MIIYHRIKDYINPRTQNITLIIIYNILYNKGYNKIIIPDGDLIKNHRIIEPNLLKSSDSRQSFYNNLRILS